MTNSAVQFVDSMLKDAIDKRASDIHLESMRDALHIRYRVDGVLYPQQRLTDTLMQAVLARIKVLAHIDVAERRLPHDGKFCFNHGALMVDCRVSTLPSLYGEKMVVRILNRHVVMLDLERLGFSQAMHDEVHQATNRSAGFFLVTGPTGSGKTTTLYALLNALKTPEKNIVTLEDPIEYSLDEITQTAIHADIGFTFACGIRAMLRQDPDVIMVGEVRDTHTAQVAIQAALTGHMVLSTVHTNDAVATVMRLIDMGVDACLINASLTGVLAQRLARMLCGSCKVPSSLTQHEVAIIEHHKLSITQTFVGVGCDACAHLGYKGRIGIFEFLRVSQMLKSLIRHRPLYDELFLQARHDGMRTLLEDGIEKVQAGVISFKELMRVVL